MFNTLQLAALCMLIATPLGVAMAIGLHRWRGKLSNAANGLMLIPIVTPEIVFGVALFLVFTQAYTGVPSGMSRQLIGHITFTVSFVVVIVRGRLSAIGDQYEEAARDLGATRTRPSASCCCRCSLPPSSPASSSCSRPRSTTS